MIAEEKWVYGLGLSKSNQEIMFGSSCKIGEYIIDVTLYKTELAIFVFGMINDSVEYDFDNPLMDVVLKTKECNSTKVFYSICLYYALMQD